MDSISVVSPWPDPGKSIDTTIDDALGDSDVVDLLNRLKRREVNGKELRVLGDDSEGVAAQGAVYTTPQ